NRPLSPFVTDVELAHRLNGLWDECVSKYDFLHLMKRSPFTRKHGAEILAQAPMFPGHLKFDTGALNKVTKAFRPWARAEFLRGARRAGT
ncbi:MAG: hypothetical protein M1826_006972, partial [Phylliscum demangeonii]